MNHEAEVKVGSVALLDLQGQLGQHIDKQTVTLLPEPDVICELM